MFRITGAGCVALLLLAQTAVIADEAAEILRKAGVQGGLVVHLDCGDGRLTAALRANDRYVVQGLDADPRKVEAARSYLQSCGLNGPVSVESCSGKRLPYIDNLVNLLVAKDLGEVPMEEVLRVLTPGGVAYVNTGTEWTKTVKPWPAAMDQWTHYLHDASNNAVAHDALVGPPQGLQWFAGPLYCRSHETDSSLSAMVSAQGRLFYILDEGPIGVADERLPQKWALLARDAFSGIQLWEVPLPDWGWPQWKKSELTKVDWSTLSGQRLRSPVTLTRRLVADGDRVYVTLGYNAPVTILDAATGATIRTCAGTEGTDEILCSGKTLVVCIRQEHVKAGLPKQSTKDGKKLSKKAARKTAAADNRDAAAPTTDRIVALNAESGKILWQVPAGS